MYFVITYTPNAIHFNLTNEVPAVDSFIQYWKDTNEFKCVQAIEICYKYAQITCDKYPTNARLEKGENGSFTVYTENARSFLVCLGQRTFAPFKSKNALHVWTSKEDLTINRDNVPHTPAFDFIQPNRREKGGECAKRTSSPIDAKIAKLNALVSLASDEDERALYNGQIAKLNAQKQAQEQNAVKVKEIDAKIAKLNALVSLASDEDERALYNGQIAKLNAQKQALTA